MDFSLRTIPRLLESVDIGDFLLRIMKLELSFASFFPYNKEGDLCELLCYRELLSWRIHILFVA